jgi:hypothetical protein
VKVISLLPIPPRYPEVPVWAHHMSVPLLLPECVEVVRLVVVVRGRDKVPEKVTAIVRVRDWETSSASKRCSIRVNDESGNMAEVFWGLKMKVVCHNLWAYYWFQAIQ